MINHTSSSDDSQETSMARNFSSEIRAKHSTQWASLMGASGQAVTDRMKRLRSPAVPKGEADIADAIERWIESIDQGKHLQKPLPFTAIKDLIGPVNSECKTIQKCLVKCTVAVKKVC